MSTPTIHSRAAEPSDAQAICALMCSDGVVQGTLQMPLAPVASRVERLSRTTPSNQQIVAVNADQQIVGYANLFNIEQAAFADNERAIAPYRRLGFVEEGRMKAYALRGGEYADALAMARPHPKQATLSKSNSCE